MLRFGKRSPVPSPPATCRRTALGPERPRPGPGPHPFSLCRASKGQFQALQGSWPLSHNLCFFVLFCVHCSSQVQAPLSGHSPHRTRLWLHWPVGWACRPPEQPTSHGVGQGQSRGCERRPAPSPAHGPHLCCPLAGRWRSFRALQRAPPCSPCKLWSMGKCLVSSKALLMTAPLRSAWMESTWPAEAWS